MFYFAHRAKKKLRGWVKILKFLGFFKECTLKLHSPPNMSGAQSALSDFGSALMSGAQKSGAFELVGPIC